MCTLIEKDVDITDATPEFRFIDERQRGKVIAELPKTGWINFFNYHVLGKQLLVRTPWSKNPIPMRKSDVTEIN